MAEWLARPMAMKMYSLKKNTTEGLFDNSGRNEEKEDHNVNLKEYQWTKLDEIAEANDISRNQLLRDIIDQYFAVNGLIDFRDLEETLQDIVNKLDLVLDEVEEDTAPTVEVSGIAIKGAGGGPGSEEAANIINESKDKGVERGRVEAITGKSEKPATRIMRVMADEFDHLKFKKGNNNRPSKLFHQDHLPGG